MLHLCGGPRLLNFVVAHSICRLGVVVADRPSFLDFAVALGCRIPPPPLVLNLLVASRRRPSMLHLCGRPLLLTFVVAHGRFRTLVACGC